jgi:hypothetical protein
MTTYPSNGIIYWSSNTILCTHADAGFLNETNSRSRASAHIFLLEDDPFPCYNGAILSIAQIIKIMVSAAKSEFVACFVMAREMLLHHQTLIDMSWPRPKSPIQMDNSITTWVTNKAIVPSAAKWWICISGGSVAAHLKINFVITGMLAPKTGRTTTPNITRTPTMKPTTGLIQASGSGQALKSSPNLA